MDYRIICSYCWVVGDWTCIKQSFNVWQSYCLGVWINHAKYGIIRDCLMSSFFLFSFSQIIFFNKSKIDNYMKKILIKKNYIYYKLYPLILFHFVSLILIFFYFIFFFNLDISLVLCPILTLFIYLYFSLPKTMLF